MRSSRIHIFGASGSGTTTLGARLGIRHLDTDDYYWKTTEPPYTKKHAPGDRINRIRADTAGLPGWVLSGSLCSWGEAIVADCSLAIFLHLNPNERMRRLEERERLRYGPRIKPEGDLREQHLEFMPWAASYDFDLHRAWRKTLSCPVLDMDGTAPVDTLVVAGLYIHTTWKRGAAPRHEKSMTLSKFDIYRVATLPAEAVSKNKRNYSPPKKVHKQW